MRCQSTPKIHTKRNLGLKSFIRQTLSGQETLDKLEKHFFYFFFYCYKLQFTMNIYAHNVTVSTGIKQTRENIQVEKDMH